MKKVIGVAAVIMVIMAIVLIAFSSTVSADAAGRTYDKEGGNITYSGEPPHDADDETKKISMYEGEKITFVNNETSVSVAVIVSGPYKGNGESVPGYPSDDYSVSADDSWDSDGMKTGYYFKVVEKDTGIGCWFSVDKQSFSLELVGDIDKVQEKESFNLTLKKNNKKGGVMKLTIEDDDGYSIMNDIAQDIYEVLVNYTEREFTSNPVDVDNEPVYGIKRNAEGQLVFNTKQLDMKKGKYEIISKDYATEVEETVDIEVEKWYLEMECDDEVVKDWEDIVITIQSSFYDENVTVIASGIPGWEKKTLTLDDEGKKRAKIPTESVDYGRYKITVKAEFEACAETRYVLVKKGKTSLEVPENATAGDIVHIEGTSDYGYLAVFVIDDVYKSDAAIVDDEFEWYWDTARELDGYYGIEVFIVNDRPKKFSIGDEVPEDWQRRNGVDASASLFLNYPTFSMTVSKSIVKGDPVVISGTVTGADHVYVIIFNYRGEVVFPYTENMSAVNAVATPLEEGKWTENLSALDFGEYTVIALDKGEDGRTRAIENGKWEIGGESKTLEQRVAYLMDAITSAGSDDLFDKAYFTVSAPKVSLEVPRTVGIGDEISVKAETNIKTGEKAFISLSQNSSIIKKTSALVKNGGSVDTSINTSGLRLLPGRYNVAVDISGRASDEKEVILVGKKEGEQEGEESKESILQNESVTESEAVAEANESVVEGDGEINESQEGEERKIPVSVGDLLIAVIAAIFISVVVKRIRRC